ncbi:MAG: hypothetical protein ACI9MJ_001009, partial [Alphaproteobacteria bacterium]
SSPVRTEQPLFSRSLRDVINMTPQAFIEMRNQLGRLRVSCPYTALNETPEFEDRFQIFCSTILNVWPV